MLGIYLKMRLKQLYRELSKIGLPRVLILLALLALSSWWLFNATKTFQYSLYITFGIVAGLSSLHFKRNDLSFMKINIKNYKKLIFMEYLTLLFPVFVVFAYRNHIANILILLLFILLLSNQHWQSKKHIGSQWLLQYVPKQSFEWKAGLRQSALFIILLEATALLGSSFIGSIPIVLFIIGLIPLNFYNYGEPYQILLASEMNPRKFLHQKIFNALILFSTTSLPLLVLFVVIHPSYWYIPTIEYLTFATVYCYVILLKYSFYEPNQKLESVQAFSILGSVSLIIPIFLPIIWALAIWFYFKAKIKLNYYLHDFD